MTTTLPEVDTTPTSSPPANEADVSALQDRMPDWFKTPRTLTGLVLFLGVVFLAFSYRKLWHTDLWGHLAYGRFLWESGAVPWTDSWPKTEPLMPLAEGMPWINTAWLTQLLGYAMHSAFGVPGLQFLFALSVTATVGALAWACWQKTGHGWFCLLAGLVFLAVSWQQLYVIRPQLAGMVCFSAVLAMLITSREARFHWWAVPLVFALWANLHGSFLAGLLMIGAFLCGRSIGVIRRKRSLIAVIRDRLVRRYFVLLELAAVAVLLNPYGIALYSEVWSVSGHPNLLDLTEWDPLTLRMRQGQVAALIGLALVTAYRFSPRRVSAIELLLLIGFGAMSLWSSRMIIWWAPVAGLYLATHCRAVWRERARHRPRVTRAKTSLWTVVSIGLVWICFAYTPFGLTLLHGEQAELQRSVSPDTPVDAVAWLKANPPEGQIFNTYEWGDYLLWAGPEDAQVFVASHAHLVPEPVWQHYMQVNHLTTGWSDTLDLYGVNTVLVDRQYRGGLIDRLEIREDWRIVYEDRMAVIFVRNDPNGTE